jgi:ketosteroid isomerase-like protein
MDLVRMRDDQIMRNEVYFDRAQLAPLIGSA